jgi:CheY-like chemotaxis protein
MDVLLVEDDPGDVLMTREAFAGHGAELHVVGDGAEALDFLYRRGRFTAAPVPGLILLDLNLPKIDGRQVLGEVKADADLRRIPIVVLTTSGSEVDIVRSYALHANAYVTKPLEFEEFVQVVKNIDDFFIGVVRLPRS